MIAKSIILYKVPPKATFEGVKEVMPFYLYYIPLIF